MNNETPGDSAIASPNPGDENLPVSQETADADLITNSQPELIVTT